MTTTITVSTKDFTNAFANIEKFRSTNSCLPIIQRIRLSLNEKGSELIFNACDLEIYAEKRIKLWNVSDTNFEILIEVDEIKKAMKFWKNGTLQINITLDDLQRISFSCGNKELTIGYTLWENDNYPLFPTVISTDAHCYSLQKLQSRYSRVEHSLSTDTSKSIFTGICIHGNELVACDGYTLHITRDDSLNISDEITIIPQMFTLTKDIFSEDEITIYYDKKYVVFEDSTTKIIGRLFDGEYLNYSRVIPSATNSQQIEVDKELLEDIKYLTTQITAKEKKPVIMDGNTMSISMAKSKVKIETKINVPFKVAYNVNFIMDTLKVFKDNTITMSIISNVQPMLITTDTDTAIILPVNIA
jgi:DNA polymerase III sliding clamp (beta) subunit (PCNA family)